MFDLQKLLSEITLRNPDLVESILKRRNFKPETGCVIVGGSPNEYATIVYLGHRTRAHRALYMASFGPIPDGLEVCHKCDTPACIAPWHLYAGTQTQNMADMWRRERRGRKLPPNQGEGNKAAKLTEDDVRAIRCRIAAGDARCDVAADYDLSGRHVWKIASRRAWSHITD